MTFENHIISPRTTIRSAMERLDSCQIKLCIILDDDRRAVRTVSDGDIRRALLEGADLETPMSHFGAKRPVMLPEEAGRQAILEAMQAHAIHAVVLCDAQDRPVGLIDRTSLEGTILLSPPHIGAAEMEYVHEAFADNWVAPAGPNLEAFEQRLTQVSGRKAALALSSGTAALHLALRVLDIRPGDRVYVSDLTFIASLQPILYEHAVPVLIDAEPGSWNMSPQALERQLARDARAGTLPRAIIVVHLYGQSADMAAILPLADRHGIPIIEDAAESLGATYQNRPSGSHGLLSAFSFNGNKIITTSGGGALVSDRTDLLDRARNLSTQGRDPADHYQHSQIAYNYRMSNVLAGIGRGQLDLLPERVAARQAVYRRYRDGLSEVSGISFQEDPEHSVGSRWLTVIDLDPDRIALHPYQFMRALRAQGIETRPAWKPMHMQPLCEGLRFVPHSDNDAVSPGLFLRSLCLPSGSAMGEAAQDRIIDAVRHIAREG